MKQTNDKKEGRSLFILENGKIIEIPPEEI